MDPGNRDEAKEESLLVAEERFRELCQKFLAKNQDASPRKTLFPGAEIKKVPLRPSMVDRACIKKAYVSSTPMTCAKHKPFTPNSRGSLSPIDDSADNLQPVVELERVDLCKLQDQSVIVLSSSASGFDGKNNSHPARDSSTRDAQSKLHNITSGSTKSSKLDSIISKLSKIQTKTQGVQIDNNLNITHKTVQTSTNLPSTSASKKLARTIFKQPVKERQTQTGISLETIKRNHDTASPNSSSNASETNVLLHACDRKKLIVNKFASVKTRASSTGAPWRLPSGLQQDIVPISDSFLPVDSMEDTDDDSSFLPKQPKTRKVFINKKKLANGKTRNSTKKKQEKSVPDQSRSRVNSKKTPAKEKVSNRRNQGTSSSESDFLRVPNERNLQNCNGKLQNIADNIARANTSSFQDRTFNEVTDIEKKRNKTTERRNNELQNQGVSGAIFDDIMSDEERIDNLREEERVDKTTKDKVDETFKRQLNKLRTKPQKELKEGSVRNNRKRLDISKESQRNKKTSQVENNENIEHLEHVERAEVTLESESSKRKEVGKNKKQITEGVDVDLKRSRQKTTVNQNQEKTRNRTEKTPCSSEANGEDSGVSSRELSVNDTTKTQHLNREQRPKRQQSMKKKSKENNLVLDNIENNYNDDNNFDLDQDLTVQVQFTSNKRNSKKKHVSAKTTNNVSQSVQGDSLQNCEEPIAEINHNRAETPQNSIRCRSPEKRPKDKDITTEDDVSRDVEKVKGASSKNIKKTPFKRPAPKKKNAAATNKRQRIVRPLISDEEPEEDTREILSSVATPAEEETISRGTDPKKTSPRRTSSRKTLRNQVAADVDSFDLVGPRRSGRSRRQAVRPTAGILIVNSEYQYRKFTKDTPQNSTTVSTIRDISSRKVSSISSRKVSSISSRKVSTSTRKCSTRANTTRALSAVSTISPIQEEENEPVFETPAIFETAVASTSSAGLSNDKLGELNRKSGKITKRPSSKKNKKKIQESLQDLATRHPDDMSDIVNICDGDKVKAIKWAFQNLPYRELKDIPGVSVAVITGAPQGLLKIDAGRSKPKQRTINYMMTFTIIKGQAQVGVEDKCRVFNKGDMFLVPSGGEYFIKNVNGEKDLHLLYARFPKETS